jgi:hypothetical protein
MTAAIRYARSEGFDDEGEPPDPVWPFVLYMVIGYSLLGLLMWLAY